MYLILAVIGIAVALIVVVWIKRKREQERLKRHTITADELHAVLDSKQEVLLYDVRRPLDLLADSEVILGATRVPPQELLANPSLIPRDKNAVLYCTCPGDETSRRILREALALHFQRVKLLKGGLAEWKRKGYPVEPYKETFHLEIRT